MARCIQTLRTPTVKHFSHRPLYLDDSKQNIKGDSMSKKENKNNLFDQVLQGVAVFVLMAVSTHDLSHYIRAEGITKWGMAVILVLLLMYTALAPLFRK